MVADFGIALAVSAAAGGRMTETGLSFGTPHYMSPEQATADKEITGRSDIYSLASVLYEMLTGSPPHMGSSAQQIIMKIITEQPQAVTALRRSVPPNVGAAVMKALEKLPADRFATAREFADALSNTAFSLARRRVRGGAGPVGGSLGRGRIATFAIGAALLVSVAAWGWLRPIAEPTLHVTISPPAGTSFIPNPGWPALSPDGRTVVFAAMRDGETRLYRRPVDGFRVEAIEGSDDATYPFFSPDGAWVGYFTRSRQLRKIALTGGQPTTLAEIPFWRSGAAWRSDRTIVVTSDSRGLYSVPDNGGTFAPLAESDTVAGAVRLDVPQELEDGRLLATRNDAIQRFLAGGKLLIMEPGEKRWRPVPGDVAGAYVPPGFLISRPGGEVVARRFDLASGRSTGKPVAVLDGLFDALTVNARGDVAYFAFPTDRRSFLALVDRAGNARRLAVPAAYYRHPRLSPDGTRLALNRDHDLWIRRSAHERLEPPNDERSDHGAAMVARRPADHPHRLRLGIGLQRARVAKRRWHRRRTCHPHGRRRRLDQRLVAGRSAPGGLRRQGGDERLGGRPRQRPCVPPGHLAERDRTQRTVFAGWPLAGLPVERDGTDAGVRRLVSRPRREATRLHRRWNGAGVAAARRRAVLPQRFEHDGGDHPHDAEARDRDAAPAIP